MSHHDYRQSLELELLTHEKDIGFYAILMCAMRRADTFNAFQLRVLFPKVWNELQQRYDAPGGRLEGEI